jgi:uncharacterized membrane protein
VSLLPWLLLLHVLGAIIAFGPGFTFALIGSMGGKEPMHANFATRVSMTISERIVVPLALLQGITGLGLILVLGANLTSSAFYWLDLGIVLYLIALGYSLGVQLPTVRRVVAMTSSPPPAGSPPGPPPGVPPLVKRIQRGGMFTGLLVVVIVFLMVVKPTF